MLSKLGGPARRCEEAAHPRAVPGCVLVVGALPHLARSGRSAGRVGHVDLVARRPPSDPSRTPPPPRPAAAQHRPSAPTSCTSCRSPSARRQRPSEGCPRALAAEEDRLSSSISRPRRAVDIRRFVAKHVEEERLVVEGLSTVHARARLVEQVLVHGGEHAGLGLQRAAACARRP